ncbi:MAG: succinate dehydrogenase, hydrophobic membrane anchor protein [Alphaproteobacteria bacterium]|nr:succinate dehydrogenase, hydrophobic membrane anchor protein [Alphaproteobacteria bacterium]
MSLRSPLARVRGLGSAKDGTHHWWLQRLTAVALVPLTLWFVVGVIGHVGADQAAVKAWMGSPIQAALMIAFVAVAFHHGQLGMQVVIEDYVHAEGWKIAGIVAVKLASAILALAAIVSVLRLALA